MKDNRIVQFKEWKCSIAISKYINNDRMSIELIGAPGIKEQYEPIFKMEPLWGKILNFPAAYDSLPISHSMKLPCLLAV